MVYVYAYQFMFQRKMLSKYGVFSSLLYLGVDADAYFTKVTIFVDLLENLYLLLYFIF